MSNFSEAYRKGYLMKNAGFWSAAGNLLADSGRGIGRGIENTYSVTKAGGSKLSRGTRKLNNMLNHSANLETIEDANYLLKNIDGQLLRLNKKNPLANTKLIDKLTDQREALKIRITQMKDNQIKNWGVTNKLEKETIIAKNDYRAKRKAVKEGRKSADANRKIMRKAPKDASFEGQKGLDEFNSNKQKLIDAQEVEAAAKRQQKLDDIKGSPIDQFSLNQFTKSKNKLTKAEADLASLQDGLSSIGKNEFTSRKLNGIVYTDVKKYTSHINSRMKTVKADIVAIRKDIDELGPDAQKAWQVIRKNEILVDEASAAVIAIQKKINNSPFSKLSPKQLSEVEAGIKGIAARAELVKFKAQKAALEPAKKVVEKTIKTVEKDTRLFKKRYIGGAAITGGVVYSMGSDQPKQTEELNKYLLK